MSKITYIEGVIIYNVPQKEANQIRNIERAFLQLLRLNPNRYRDIFGDFNCFLSGQKLKTYKPLKHPEPRLPVTGKDS